VVLVRRTTHRLAAIDKRLEVLDGFIKVYLNLDEVIRIIREEDDAKAGLIRTFALTDNQAEAILNMRLRSLRRLEEMEIRKEHKALTRERKDMQALLASEKLRWDKIADELEETSAKFGGGPLGARRTEIGGPPAAVDISAMAQVEREPITVILSEKGWVRAVKGHIADGDGQKFKEGDALRLLLPCETTDRLVLFATDGRVFTLRAGDIPRGRGDGQPIRLMVDLANQDDILHFFIWRADTRYLVAGATGRGFVVKSADLIAEKRTGKQILSLRESERAAICIPATGDHVAVVGENRRLLVFPLAELPEMARGAGVALQKYREGGLKDAKVFTFAEGLSWKSGERTRTETNLRDWVGERAQAGRMPPSGFPRSGKFSG
jgi:topoisomerase-4 subunit A